MPAKETPSCGSGLVAGAGTFTAMAQRPSGMTCARRPAGARKPASSTGSPSGSDAHTGRRRARLSLLLPVLALLFGAFSFFSAAPAEAQVATNWLRVGPDDGSLRLSWAPADGVGANVTSWDVHYTSSRSVANNASAGNNVSSAWVSANHTGRSYSHWITGLNNGTGYRVRVRAVTVNGNGGWAFATVGGACTGIGGSAKCVFTPRSGTVTATVSVTPDPVAEGSRATVTVMLAQPWNRNWDIVVPLTATNGTAESGDWFIHVPNVLIRRGSTTGTTYIQTRRDADTDNETVRVALDTANLEPGVTAGATTSVTFTITDTGTLQPESPGGESGFTPPAVSLSVTPNPVDEGSPVRVTAMLSEGLPAELTLPVVVTRGTSEDGDHGTLSSIVIPPLATSATATIATTGDSDADDETFTVALGALPPFVTAGATSSVTVTITDTTQPQVQDPPPAGPYAALIAKVREWRNDPRYRSNPAHTKRWDRVLLALGATVPNPAGLTPMTAAEAQVFADKNWTRWIEVAAALKRIEGGGTPLTVPVVSLAAGAPVTEGTPAGFALTAAPAPTADLAVAVEISRSGALVDPSVLGRRTVTIPAGQGSAAFTVATVDDAVGEPDGAVVASLRTGGGYTVGDAARARVAVADDDEATPAIVTKRGMAREGSDAAVVFTVRLSAAASGPVTVDYATANGAGRWAGTAPAAAGADYTATSGTLAFAAGETLKTVSVPILDDAIDEGTEYFLLRFSRPQGAHLEARYRETQGLIRNSDPLQAMWLSRFGRTVASDAVAALTARFETPREVGSHLTMLGQRVNLSQDSSGDGAGARALAGVLTGFAQAFGAPNAPPAAADDPFARHGLTHGWNGSPALSSPARRVTARDLLMGMSFRAVLPAGAGTQFTSWGQGASVSQFSADVPGLGLTGETATGSMGFDYEHGRLLTGFAMMHSVGDGTARDAGWRYAMGSTATTVLPYARLALTDRLSAWAMAGTGTGRLSLDIDGPVPQHYGTDLAMTLAATGVRGELVAPEEPGGFALALKGDAFWVRTESDRVASSEFGSLMGARGESSRVRAMLDGSRTFALAGGATLKPSLELGLRQDGGDAETGTGVEFGAGLGYADPSRGLDVALRVHGLAAHAEDRYSEWGVSGQLRLAPGAAGRGLSASFTPSYGVDPQGSERLWALPESSGLAANGEAVPSSRVDAELGYGMALFGDRFTGTPNVGLGLSDTAREMRMGWRLTSAVRGDPGFEVSLDATRREATNVDEPAEHGVMLRSLVRW